MKANHNAASSVQTHTTRKDLLAEKRWETVHLIPDILAQPDEVWIRPGKAAADMTYVKFYGDKVMIVRTRMEQQEGKSFMQVSTWYELREADETKNRRGVLAKKMPADR